jgi:hypothetical protein
MPPHNPVEFVRRLLNGSTQAAGNRVQIEDADGNAFDAANPVPVTAPDTGWDVTPTLSASGAYAAGDALGALMTLTDIAYANGKSVVFQNCILNDLAEQIFTASLLIFNANPSASTITDKDPINIVDADAGKLVAVIPFTAFKDLGGFKTAMGDEMSVKATPGAASRTLWAAFMVDTGTPTLGTGQILAHFELFRNY